jgi:3-methyl-2-oxobutanoate hydroxymethyltransferase
MLGGYKVQGVTNPGAADACRCDLAGTGRAAMLLLECVPSELAAEITQAVKIR